jgi:hypothetical protein
MALITCRECEAQVSTEALSCPHCGVPRPFSVLSEVAPAPTAPAAGKGAGLRKAPQVGLVAGLAMVLVVGVALAWFVASRQTYEPTRPDTTVTSVLAPIPQPARTPVQPAPTPEASTSATVSEIDLPTPRLPITPAASVLPAWSESEDIEGNHPILTGLYVGALGKRPLKLVITSVDTVSKKISGYSETSTATAAFEGTYTLTIEEPNSRVAENVIDFRTWVFQTTLLESRGISGNGVFQLRFECTDAQGSSVHGTWTSWDGRLYREIRLTDTYTARER